MYSDALMGRFLEPSHVGDLDNPQGTARAGNETCGDVVQLELMVTDGVIVDARFRAQGCATAIASADAICELAVGTSITEAQMIDYPRLSRALGGIPDERTNCAAVVLEALRSALEQVRTRESAPSA